MIKRWMVAIVGGAWIVVAIVLFFVGSMMIARATVDEIVEGFGLEGETETDENSVWAGTLLIWCSYFLAILGVIVLIIGVVMGMQDRQMGM